MEYNELEDIYEFHRNMRKTSWEQLFPHWWDTRDALLKAIGDEVEWIKAMAIFALLNAGIKPPVLLWQESIEHKEYNANFNITELPHSITIQAPLYKTWGQIILTNNTEKDLDGIIIKLDNNHGYAINQLITQSDTIIIDLTNNKITLNDKTINAQQIDEGMPYFVTQQNNEEYDKNTPLHNEVIRISFETNEDEPIECDIDVDVQLENAVFTNEQNIEVTGLEAVPIEKIELYAKYDFEFNQQYNGWHKVYEKKYNKKTNVIYDMITTQLYTKEFYVDVYFKTLQYPYQVGFPCFKDAEKYSKYHVNDRLDKWGEVLGLQRRLYKDNIKEKEYKNTYPIYYPFDIEQDYYYYKRLTSEYVWNDLAVNDVDILDTDNNPIIRLYSIDPFINDVVVHAKSTYPVDKEFTDYNEYKPNVIFQRPIKGIGVQTEFDDIVNLISDNDEKTSITLNNISDNNDVIYKREDSALQKKRQDLQSENAQLTQKEQDYLDSEAEKSVRYIASATHQSTELVTYFDLSSLPKDINIDNIEVILEADSSDNKTNKYSTENTGISIPHYKDETQTFIPLTADKPFQLKKQLITYSNNQIIDKLKHISIDDENVIQEFKIGEFKNKIHDFVKIPFVLLENNEEVNDITDIWLYYNGNIRKASYIEEDGINYIYCYIPNITIMNTITIVCKSQNHYPFTCDINIIRANQYDEEDSNKLLYEYIAGPVVDGEIQEELVDTIEWHTNDIRNLIQTQGIYFHNILKNTDEQSSTTINQYNIYLKVSYSQKKSDFLISTYINKRNIDKPYIGQYNFKIENIGDKPLKTHVDVVTPPNIQLERNNFDINLNINESFQPEPINISPTYPIDDGFYDIVTICEDIIKTNSIEVFSNGLIETGINMYPHNCKYDGNGVLKAEIQTIDGGNIDSDDAKVQFYIKDYLVGTAPVKNNKAELFFTPSDYDFISSGNLPLVAKFIGTTKYSSSTKKTTIFINKNTTRMTLMVKNIAPYNNSITLKAQVEYYNGEEYLPVDDGNLEFYINDEVLTTKTTQLNGLFVAHIDKIKNPPGNYLLRAKYFSSDIYGSIEQSQDFEIIGGNTETNAFNIETKPQDTFVLKAQVVDDNGNNISDGYVDFYLKDKDDNYVDLAIFNFKELTKNITINNGIAESKPIPIHTTLSNDSDIIQYTIEAFYHYNLQEDATDDIVYQSSMDTALLIIKKGEVVIQCQPVFYGTQHEPLGFYVNINDYNTTDAINYGMVKLTLSHEQIVLEEPVNNGNVFFIYKPIELSINEWHQLEKFSFDVFKDELLKTYNGDESDKLLVDFYYNTEDGILYYIGNRPNDDEYIFITDGNLYARTTKDTLRQYSGGIQDVEIEYISNNQYSQKTKYIINGLDITTTDINLDIHSYDLYYTDNTEIVCYVSNYTFNEGNVSSNNIDGSVQFFIDNNIIDTVTISNNKAILNNKLLSNISAGTHLLQVKYIPNNNNYFAAPTYSYSLLTLRKQQSLMDVNISRTTPNMLANVIVDILLPQNIDIPLTGEIKLFLNDNEIDSYYLNGNEQILGVGDKDADFPIFENTNIHYKVETNFNMIIPDDIDINEYKITALYSGNEFFSGVDTFSNPLLLQKEKVDVNIKTKNDIYVAKGESCFVDVVIEHEDDIINDGQVVLREQENEITSSYVINNHARLLFTPNIDANPSDYIIIYKDANNYSYQNKSIQIHQIEPLDNITIPNEYQSSIEEALMCIKDSGTIYIQEDIILTQTININKNCNIIGENGTSLIKDINNLLVNFNNIQVTKLSSLQKPYYKINNLSLKNLNTTDFFIKDTKQGQSIFFKGQSKDIEIFLCEDGNFYTTEFKLDLKKIISSINISINTDTQVNFDNLIFKSNDNELFSDFIIYNQGQCNITHSIIEKTVQIINKGDLIANRNLMYCEIQGSGDLNNNWWGSNTAPYQVDNNIILQISSNKEPTVVSEECSIIGKMIGSNGKIYDIPQVDFAFTADTGYFSIDNGKMTNQKITTKYLDAEKAGNIYLTVDNETVSHPIYNYENKTEIIFDDIHEAIMNYQTSIVAKVQSCADTYYEFDKNNNIIKNTNTINEGYLTFYIQKEGESTKQQIGYTPVVQGQGTVKIFFIDTIYDINTNYKIYAKYHTEGEYFDSFATTTIKTINEDDICFISQNGNDNNDGKYSTPVKTMSKALSLDKNTIYITNGNYSFTDIQIDKNINIKKYNGTVVFNNLDGNSIFNIHDNRIVNISGIDFTNNNVDTLINNSGQVNIKHCIFYKNTGYKNEKGIIFNNQQSASLNISLSAIVDNDIIDNDNNTINYSKCWFGTNNPEDKFNNYVIMTHESSKNKIYNGALAHVTAKLATYKLNGTEYKLNDDMPLRIVKFATDIGSAKPIKDYTYNNMSTSLINTTENNNTDKYIITLDNDTFYDNHKINLKCIIQNVFDERTINNKTLKIQIQSDNIDIDENTINIDENIDIVHGIATYTIPALSIGRYLIHCTYIENGTTYRLSTHFYVKKLYMQVVDFNTDKNNHLYSTQIHAKIQDNFGNNINNETINISIDNNIIKNTIITNGVIQETIKYNMLPPGKHILSIANNTNNESKYSDFYYETALIVYPSKTNIIFDYNVIEADRYNSFIIQVNDELGNKVQSGNISIEIDNIIIKENIPIINGIGKADKIKITERGQHSIVIYYNDNDGYYKDSTYINNKFGVGVFNIKLLSSNKDISDTSIQANIGNNFVLELTVQDIAHQDVNDGFIDVFIDNILFSKKNHVSNGTVVINEPLPNNIYSGEHTLQFNFYGNVYYLETSIDTILNINKIQTDIHVDSIIGESGQNTTINYSINSFYGAVKTGKLSAFIKQDENEIFLSTTTVDNSITNKITFTTPLLPSGNNYNILFRYHDDDENYADSELSTQMTINKSKVIITPNKTSYYPQKDFIFDIDIKDKSGHNINDGTVDIYIDNIKEYENITVLNGQVQIPLLFEYARNYLINIVYHENQYFAQTNYLLEFKTKNIDINDINFKNELSSLPEVAYINELIFDVDDYNIKDGIVDIFLDNNLVNQCYIAENNKNINFNINKQTKGQHILTIKYHDSRLFNDFEKNFDFTIISKKIDLRINMDANYHSQNISIFATDKILIQTNIGQLQNTDWIPQAINGVVNYYLMIPHYRINELGEYYIHHYNNHFIGSEVFNNEYVHEEPYEYTLTSNLLEYNDQMVNTHYKIKAEFIGNEEYDESEECIDLAVQKQDIHIVLLDDDNITEYNENITAEYQSKLMLNIGIKNNNDELINNQELVDVYIDDTFIGSCMILNGQGLFEYKMKENFTVGEHIITIVFNGSTINKGPKTFEKDLIITPMVPILEQKVLNMYAYSDYLLEGIIKDSNNNIITTGLLQYIFEGEMIAEITPSQSELIQTPLHTVDGGELVVKYISDNSSPYNDFEKSININVLPNPIKLSLYAPEKIYRYEPFDIQLKAESKTTNAPIDLQIDRLESCNDTLPIESYEMKNGILNATISYDDLHDGDVVTNCFKTQENDIFESASILLNVTTKNKSYVTIDTSKDISSSNAHTIAQAIDLVSDYGTIEIINPIENESIEQLSKNITIQGNTQLTNCTINNPDKKLTIKNLTFQDTTQTVITNNGTLNIDNCTFKNNQNSTIYTDGAATIQNTHFNNNQAEKGACLYVANKNYKTSITNCTFNNNNASLYGGCIYSNKVNDMEIINNEFSQNNYATSSGSSIYAYGNITISSNSFYKNTGNNEIHLLRGVFSIDKNLFDGTIRSIQVQQDSTIDADFNYWGYNDINSIEENNPNIEINSYLRSSCEFYQENESHYAIGHINEYINRLESEVSTINTLEQTFPISIKNDENIYDINQPIEIQPNDIVIIGQDEFYNDK